MRTFIGIVVTFFIFFILIFMIKFVYVVPEIIIQFQIKHKKLY